jgi:hypothetical protein
MQDGQFGQGGANVQNPQGPGHLFEVGGFFPHPAAQFLKQGRLVFISGDSLTEADFSLSATWFPGVAAAVLEILKLYPVIAHQKPELPVPRGRALEVGEKGPGAGAVPAFLTHNLYSCRLALGLNVPGGVGDDVQFHAIIQLFLGSILGLFQSVQGHSHSLPEPSFTLTDRLPRAAISDMGASFAWRFNIIQ